MPFTKFPDYYSVLNLPFGSSPDVIKKYYRELAKIYHPDNKATGQVTKFQHLLAAYQVLSGEFREAYDKAYLKHLSLKANVDKAKKEFLLPQERLIYTTSMTFLARRGLMRTGFRKKDRAKFTGLNHDLDLIIKKEEATKRILVKIPLTELIKAHVVYKLRLNQILSSTTVFMNLNSVGFVLINSFILKRKNFEYGLILIR
jgi:molecular chaperone DnaJ